MILVLIYQLGIQIVLTNVEGVSTHRVQENPTVCVNVWQRAKDSITSQCIVAWCQWQYLTVECMAKPLCALQLIIERQWTRAEVCEITELLMFTTASWSAVQNLLHLIQVCGVVFEYTNHPLTLYRTEQLIEAELSECFGVILNTESDQTSTQSLPWLCPWQE